MAVRKRTGFKVQKGKSSERLKAANKRLAIANAQIKAAKARSKVAKERSKVAKARIKVAKQKVKSKSKARAIQTKRGVVKARGGGPAKGPTVAKRGGVGLGSLFNPFPEAAAYQNPFTLGSYSGAIPGKALLRRELRRHVGDRVFFAGEATAHAYSTVHGADLSGKRAATDLFISPALD